MSSTPSQALTKRDAEQSLMPPPPPPKRIKRPATALDEDVYTNALSEIIARDFFPGLLETQIKQEYLEALDSKDKDWIASSKKKLSVVMTPGRKRVSDGMTPRGSASGRFGDTSKGQTPRMTPGRARAFDTPTGWGGETPMSVASSTAESASASESKGEIPDVSNMGLMAFQAKYTSEDNESFNKLVDKQNAKRRDHYRWLWSGNKIPSARQIAHQRQEAKRITARGENPGHYHPPQEEKEKEKDQSEGQEIAIKTDLDARPAKPDAWDSKPENQLMFLPSSIEDTHETIQQRAEAQSRVPAKRILYQNTRLQDPDPHRAAESKVPPSPSVSAIQDAIAGRPRLSASEAGFSGGETPRVNGYAFVDEDEPLPDNPPTHNTDNDEDDLSILGPASSTPNPFQIRENRKREDLHHRMVDRVARTKRAEKAARETASHATPRFPSSPHLDFGLRSPAAGAASPIGKSLTPAAQKLLQRVGGSTPGKSSQASGSGLRNIWTPTPKRAR